MHICNVEFLDLVKESLLAEKKFAGKPILMNTFHINKLLGIEENGPCLQIFTTVWVHHCTCFSIANNKITVHIRGVYSVVLKMARPMM